MDTREKIVKIENLPALLLQGEWAAITGLFDPLTQVQAERLSVFAEKGRMILAVVLPDSATLIAVEARAALVAALRQVDAVVIADDKHLTAICSGLPNVCIHHDRQGEERRSAEFIEFILRRQHSAEIFT